MSACLFIGCKESLYMVAPKYPRNHFISEKYKTLQFFKLRSLQNSLLVQLYTSDSDCKYIGNIPGSDGRALQLFLPFRNDVSSVTKASSLQCWYQSREQTKISCNQVIRVWGMLQYYHVVLFHKSLNTTDRCAEALSRRRNKLLVLHFWGCFLLTAFLRRRRTSMSVHFFIHNNKSCKLHQRFPGTFWGYYVRASSWTKYPHSTNNCLNHK